MLIAKDGCVFDFGEETDARSDVFSFTVTLWLALRCLGEAELALGDVRHAREHLERDATLTKRMDPGTLALARFSSARALVARPAHARPASDADEARAVTLATQARDELLTVADRYPFLKPSLEAVDAWRADPKHERDMLKRPP